MKYFTHLVALLSALIIPASALAQDPFGGKTKTVYIFNAGLKQVLSDYNALTPKTYMCMPYAPSDIEYKLFEVTTLNEETGESVLYNPDTFMYMKLPAGPGIINTTDDVASRSTIIIKDVDGHKRFSTDKGYHVCPFKNGNFYMLGVLNDTQFAGYCSEEQDLWDFVEPEKLNEYLISIGVDPDYDPHFPDKDASFEELSDAIKRGQDMLLRLQGGLVETGDCLITDPETQFLSDYSDPDEGADFSYLVDNNYYTYWHSNWHDEEMADLHSLIVVLPEAADGNSYSVRYTGRLDGNNCSPVVMDIYGGMVDELGHITWDASLIASLDRTNGVGAFAGWGDTNDAVALSGTFTFQAKKDYQAYRFEPAVVCSNEGEGVVNYFNYSEFQLFAAKYQAPTANAGQELVDELLSLLDEAYYMGENDNRRQMIEAIDELLETIEAVGISNVRHDAGFSTTRIYDLQGRVIGSAHATLRNAPAGIRIQNGRKYIK